MKYFNNCKDGSNQYDYSSYEMATVSDLSVIDNLRRYSFKEQLGDFLTLGSRGELFAHMPLLSTKVPSLKVVPETRAERKQLREEFIFWRLSH